MSGSPAEPRSGDARSKSRRSSASSPKRASTKASGTASAKSSAKSSASIARLPDGNGKRVAHANQRTWSYLRGSGKPPTKADLIALAQDPHNLSADIHDNIVVFRALLFDINCKRSFTRIEGARSQCTCHEDKAKEHTCAQSHPKR
jgi:hypothetical protein